MNARPIALLILVAGCSPQAINATDAAVDGGPCAAPLSAYCNDPGVGGIVMCGAALDERLSLIRAGVSCTESPVFPEFGPSTGSCGSLAYVLYSPHGVDKTTEYFNASGALVAAHYESDTNAYCNGTTFEIAYGPVPTCDRIPTDGGTLHCDTRDLGVQD